MPNPKEEPKFREDEHIVENKELSIAEALIPVFALVAMLAYNVFVFGDDALSGSNQFILLMGGAVAAIVGIFNKVSYEQMIAEVAENVRSTTGALLILLMVGALSGTWLVSGIIPAMIYYGLQILNPTIFLAASVIICAIISIATGSSWTTAATVGIALIGIGDALGISLGMTAGAVLSGAYFGDKMSPLSDTTNLAPAMAGGDLFSHIRYMTYTTVPTIVVTLIVFIIIGFTLDTSGVADTSSLLNNIGSTFNINGWLFIVPLAVIGMIVKKAPPLMALLVGTLLGGVFALIFQPDIVANIGGGTALNFETGYIGILNAITVDTEIATSDPALNDLFSSGGMSGMLGTIWLIVCAMVFGGIMDGIGALERITESLLKLAKTTFGLFASTVGSCLALNVTASDQYLAIVVPGKMFAKAYEERGLAPENLSRSLEDSGTVTSVLVPWNTCGAYHSGVLGVGVGEYALYAIFNWLSPFMTLLFAAFRIKIKQLATTAAE
ncbi:MAG: Na+/H+ antiporter NhaC [Muricauda sp.]|jgi:NhaC family Na+:H+ antiporter|nr:Na+/H+ antiporter NhaC [Allomuricauda sp.]MBO6533236.1 Na+/H+ antiporter NhaC [Allomuricauda sp.]MBO6589183.1 Na+/H+ antiporter NhaC [Allomuricauda sp.]MBO6618808.1 Na+/H+ antiporter NhaC [Allomuricauda sp.]MBO6644721.1 Na+/H+ antiporter NhaC [Allomuricauda sp.]MBO6746621.1 Na+/H+ antiporter NhaC [Allomuricauda sp.]